MLRKQATPESTDRPRLLVTGASGFLGRWIAFFAASRWEVVGTYLQHPVTIPGVTMVPLDICAPQAVQEAFLAWRPHAVIHTAAFIGDPSRMHQVIVEGTRHVAEAAAAVRARFIHISTDLVFDGEKGWYTEEDPPQPRLPYGQTKWAAEQIVQATAERPLIVRPSLLCHLDPPDPRTARALAVARGEADMVFFVDEYRTPAWVTDVAQALLELLARPVTGILHLAGPQRLSRYELAVRLVQAHGLDPTRLRKGYRRDVAPLRPRDTSLDTTKARRLLKTPLHSVDEGIQKPAVSRLPDPALPY